MYHDIRITQTFEKFGKVYFRKKEFAPSITIENTFAVTSGEIPRLKEMFIEERVT